MWVWIVINRSRGIESLFLQSEEDVGACLDRAGGRGFRSEVRDSLPSDGILLVVKGDEDLGGMLKSLNGGIGRYENVFGEEHKSQKRTELDGSVVAGALGVLTGPQAEVETQDNQVGDMLDFFIRGVSRCGHDRVDNTKRNGLFFYKRGVFVSICFDFLGKALVQYDASLGVEGLSGVGKSCQ